MRCELKNPSWGQWSASRGLPSDPNSYPEWRNFQFAPNYHYGFFFLHTLPSTIAFRLEYMLFYHINAEITTFSIKRCSVRFLSNTLTSKRLKENWRQHDVKTSKMTSKLSSWRHARESSYIPRVRRHFLAPVGFTGMQEFQISLYSSIFCQIIYIEDLTWVLIYYWIY